MHEKPQYIDSSHHVISNGRWHTMWFLMIENLHYPIVEDPKYGQEAPNLRSNNLEEGPK